MNKKLFFVVCVSLFFVILFESCRNKAQANIQNNKEGNNMKIDKTVLRKEEILSWNYDEALALLGNPVSYDSFTMNMIPEFRVELLNFLPLDSNLVVKELTWETDSAENLTIWYIQKDTLWNPVHFLKWDKDMQF
jgi:hypothetical protein